jgi:hypothetical protein
LENFEGAPVGGYMPTAGGVILDPGAQTDSVDADDGSIDGFGRSGRSWFSGGMTSFFSFSFDAAALDGQLPTHAGIVWTDVGQVIKGPETQPEDPVPPQGVIDVSFAAYGPGNTFLGFAGPFTLGDGNPDGGTAEDRFFGVVHSGGIESIQIFVGDGAFAISTDWEVDHLQFGVQAIPEPEQWLLMALGVGAIAWRARRRAKAACRSAA